MKRFFISFVMMPLASLSLSAQEERVVSLDEVTVKGARTVPKVDGQWLYPSRQMLSSSTNGYSLLAKLALPHIRVDETTNSITALTNLGGVQVRINDVVASREELLALDMGGVERVEYIDNPGVRYGDGIAYVINIKVRKPVSGYVVGTELTNSLTTANGEETVYGRWNRGKSEFALKYGLDYRRFSGIEAEEQASYALESGQTVRLRRYSLHQKSRDLAHNAQLTYSLTDSNYVFQAKWSGSGSIKPSISDALMATVADDQVSVYRDGSSSERQTPSIDLYFHQDFRRHQSLTANVVGTCIKTEIDVESNEGTPYLYHIAGRTRSLWSEAVYENRLKPFTLSGGVQYSLRYSHNVYDGDVLATNGMHTSSVYLFSQVKGHLGKLSYMGGLGTSYRHYSQGESRHYFWLFRPKLTVSYPIAEKLNAKYDFEINQHVSQIALVSDVSIKQNAMETLLGNPEIHPNRFVTHQLQLSCSARRFTSQLQAYCRLNPHCNMEKYIRQDGHFYKTQSNADNKCNMFFVDSYNQYDIVPEKLTVTLYGGIYHFYNRGEDYTHRYTSFNGGCSLNAYLNRWTLGAYADNGWNFMEGEHRGHQAPAWYFTASYRASRSLTVSLFAQHPFCQHPLTYRTEIVSRYVQKEYAQHYRDYGNLLTLKLSFRLDHGRKYQGIERLMNHRDSETGILSK